MLGSVDIKILFDTVEVITNSRHLSENRTPTVDSVARQYTDKYPSSRYHDDDDDDDNNNNSYYLLFYLILRCLLNSYKSQFNNNNNNNRYCFLEFSLESDSHLATPSKYISRVLRNSKTYYRVHNKLSS
jgi:hypothetical protein